MSGAGFWVGGPDEHRRAVEARLAVWQDQLAACTSEPDRARIAAEIEEAKREVTKSGGGQILW